MLEFGIVHSNAQYRKSVGAIIINPRTKKILVLDWKIYAIYGIVQGGQEENEDEITALEREIIEESGYTDFTIKEKLGENIISYFYVPTKQVWRKLELACYIVLLNSEEHAEQKLEKNESFEIKWIDANEYLEQINNHTSTESHNFQGLGEFVKRALQTHYLE